MLQEYHGARLNMHETGIVAPVG